MERMNRVPLLSHLVTCQHGEVSLSVSTSSTRCVGLTFLRSWRSRGHRLDGDALAERGLGLACELEQLARGRFTDPPNRRLAGHLLKHSLHWFWFLIDPTIDATNYRGEQAIRPAVVNRKVWGGNRTWRGARWQSILTSIIRTWEQRALRSFDFLLDALCRPTPQLLPA
jgi:hypothetical protein